MTNESAAPEVASKDTAATTASPVGEDEIERALIELDARISDALELWSVSVRDDAVRALARVFVDAGAAHDAVFKDVGPEDHRSYRNGVRDDVLVPLRMRLEELRVEERIDTASEDLRNRLAALSVGLPTIVSRKEPADLYRRRPDDRFLRRVRKLHVRWARTARRTVRRIAGLPKRLIGRKAARPPKPRQHVPLLRLASYHLEVRLPRMLEPLEERLHERIAGSVAAVAGAVTNYGHVVVQADAESTVRAGRGDAAELAGMLAEALERASAVDVEDISRDVEAKASEAARELRQDVRRADTFMLSPADRTVAEVSRGPGRDWGPWHRRARSRIGLMAALLSFREDVLSRRSVMLKGVAKGSFDPAREALKRTQDTLRSLFERASETFERADAGAWADEVQSILDDGLAAVRQHLLDVFDAGDFPRKAVDTVDSAASDVLALTEALPDRIEVNVLHAGDAVDPEAEPREVELREYASRAYDTLLLENLATGAREVADAIRLARDEAGGVPGILKFNLEAALEELSAAESGEDRLQNARELVLGGLERSESLLGRLSKMLSEAQTAFEARAGETLETGFERLHERLRVEERMRGQMLDLRSGALEHLRDVADRATEQARRSSVLIRKTYRKGMRRGRSLIRIGQEAAGLAAATEEERMETVDVLANVDRVMEGLPLVYRRLFSFAPVKDPTILEGRSLDFAALKRHVDYWNRGVKNALVLTGFHGSGLTSFLRAASETVLEGADVRILDLHDRVRTEEELSARLAASLDVPSASTLDGLSDALVAAEAPASRVCFVEHLEHLFLRGIGGTDLVAKFLTFLSRTDSHVLWFVTTSDYAWQIISAAQPAAARLVRRHALTPISRPVLEALVLNRHRRSGLPLRFDPPTKEFSPIIYRRYRKAKTEAKRQALMREDFFDRLHRATEQNIMLALLYWLRSVEMVEDEEVLAVRALRPLSFSMLQSFDLQLAFTLKALLEHASLTVGEHSEIFQVPAASSHQSFETLGNLLLIEPMTKDDVRTRIALSTVEKGVRYRIRPLLIHPIQQYLRGKNILH